MKIILWTNVDPRNGCYENSPKQDFAEKEIDEIFFWNLDQPKLTLPKQDHYEALYP